MGPRSGDLDPGILEFLMRTDGYSIAQIDDLLNHQSGLLGISESTADMRDLQKSGSHLAQLAIDAFFV